MIENYNSSIKNLSLKDDEKGNIGINERTFRIRKLIYYSSSNGIPLWYSHSRIITIGERIRTNIIDCSLIHSENTIPIYERSTFITNTINYKSFKRGK